MERWHCIYHRDLPSLNLARPYQAQCSQGQCRHYKSPFWLPCLVFTSSLCIIFALFLSGFLCAHSSRDFIESLLCRSVVAKRCPPSLVISCDFLRCSNCKICGEDGLLGHNTILSHLWRCFRWLLSSAFAALDQRRFGFFRLPLLHHASHTPPVAVSYTFERHVTGTLRCYNLYTYSTCFWHSPTSTHAFSILERWGEHSDEANWASDRYSVQRQEHACWEAFPKFITNVFTYTSNIKIATGALCHLWLAEWCSSLSDILL